MKKIIVTFSIMLVLASCKEDVKTSHPDLDLLQKEKKELLSQMDSLSHKLKGIEKSIKALDTVKKLQKVTVFTTKDTVFNHYIALQGTVASDQNINIHPEYGGTVRRILVREGQKVYKGQLLMQLDAQVLLDKVTELKTQLSLATTTYERQERLWSQKIGTEMAYLGAKTQKEALENSLRSLNTQINKMRIKAPFSGVVDKIFPKVGELSGPQFPLVRLINLNKMYLEVDVPETYLPSIKKGTFVALDFVAINKQQEAKINEIGNFINPANRSFKVKILLNNKDHSIKPNMLADIKVNDFSGKGVVLPVSLIQMNQQGDQFVYAVESLEDKQIVKKKILQLGESYNNQVLINEGLETGEIIINEGGKFVKDGDEVSVKH